MGIHQRKLYEIIEGANILTLSEESREAIIEGMLYPQDYILLVAEEKVGKTVYVQQLACSLTSGIPFLNCFEIPKPQNVWLFLTEGKCDDIKDRFVRMKHKVELDVSRLKLIPTFFRFNTNEGLSCLWELIARYKDTPEKPNVIIIDALYRAVKGSIKNDDVINEFHHIMGILFQQFECAIILVHHMTKPMKTPEGKHFDRSDKDTFGSTFLPAGVDHMFWLEKWKKDLSFTKDRMLKCDTQRAGNIVTNIRLRLHEPDPLFFELISLHTEEKKKVLGILKESGKKMNLTELMLKTDIGRSVLYIVLKELLETELITKEGMKEKWFQIRNR